MIHIETNEINGIEVSIAGNSVELYHEFVSLLTTILKMNQLLLYLITQWTM